MDNYDIKVIDYKSAKDLEKFLNDGWAVVQAFGYKSGLVMVLKKNVQAGR